MHKFPLSPARSTRIVFPSPLVGRGTPFDTDKAEISTLLAPLVFALAGLTLSLVMITVFNAHFPAPCTVGVDLDPGALWPPIPCLVGP